MYNRTEHREQRVFTFIVSFIILYLGFTASLFYEMGKNGLGNIDWAFVLKTNIPVFIISVMLFIRAFNHKKIGHEND